MFSHVAAWQQSGLSQKEYCRQHHIAYHLLPYWLKRHRLQSKGATTGKGFMAVSISQPAVSANPVMELVRPDGSRLLFYTQPESRYLQSLLG